jgi:hypothetical protein
MPLHIPTEPGQYARGRGRPQSHPASRVHSVVLPFPQSRLSSLLAVRLGRFPLCAPHGVCSEPGNSCRGRGQVLKKVRPRQYSTCNCRRSPGLVKLPHGRVITFLVLQIASPRSLRRVQSSGAFVFLDRRNRCSGCYSTRDTAFAVHKPPRIVGVFKSFNRSAILFKDRPLFLSPPITGRTRAANAADAATLPAAPFA